MCIEAQAEVVILIKIVINVNMFLTFVRSNFKK